MTRGVRLSAVSVVVLCLSSMACGGASESPPGAFLDSGEALEHASKHAAEQLESGQIVNILLEPGGTGYLVRLTEMPEPGHRGFTAYIDVNGTTGEVTEARRILTPVDPSGAETVSSAAGLVDGVVAYRAARGAISGYEHFDALGKLTVELHNGTFVVTFPLAPREDHAVRAADYAYQIRVDGKTAEVTQILTSS